MKRKVTPTPGGMIQLAGIETRKAQGTTCMVRREGADAIAAAFLRGDHCVPMEASGRGGMVRFPWSCGRWGVVRKCLRGGVFGGLLGDGYFLENRPKKEFFIHLEAEKRGLPVPKILGVAWSRRGPWFRGSIATELMEGADLAVWRGFGQASDAETAVFTGCGRAIRAMHDAGIWHADLQVKNLFVAPDGIMLLDFDRAKIYKDVGIRLRSSNLLRLRRSMEKRGWPAGCFQAVVDGYGGIDIPPGMNWLHETLERVRAWTKKNR